METDFNYIDCIEKVKQHDDSASEALYRFTFPIVQKQVALFVHNRQDQEDLLQNIFIKIFEQIDTLKDPEKYPGWAKMIARNTCMDYGRHLKLENNLIQWKTTVSDEEEEGMDQLAVPTYSREFNPEAHIDAETTKELIDQILDGLSDKQRMVILLWMKQYKEAEIAKELDMPIGSVRTNCRRGKTAIEKKVIELEKQGTKLYSMSPIVFFLWLLDQYDLLYTPAVSESVCMPLYHKIKSNIQKPDINSETVHQMQNTIKDTGSNTSNAASSVKRTGKAAGVTKGGLKHGLLHSTVTKIIVGLVIVGSIGGAVVHYTQSRQDKKQEATLKQKDNKNKEMTNNEFFRLSGGEKQRIALARAMIGKPQVYLLDEITSSLDEQNAREMEEILLAEDAMVLYVCHKIIPELKGQYEMPVSYTHLTLPTTPYV